jgi:hypothetical protein
MLLDALSNGGYVAGNVVLLPDGSQVNLDVFLQMFPQNCTYAQAIEIDGGTKGYKQLFDTLKEKGLFN